MVYGVLRLINFAHGEVFMLGAYTALLTSWFMGYGKDGKMPPASPVNLVIMLVVCMIVCGTIGVLIERFAYRPMRNQPRIAALITAIGVSLLFQYGGALVLPILPPPSISEHINPYTSSIQATLIPPDASLRSHIEGTKGALADAEKAWEDAKATHQPDSVIKDLRDKKNAADRASGDLERKLDNSGAKIRVPQGQLIMFATTLVLMAALTYLVKFTPIGRAMRAVSRMILIPRP